VEVLIDLVQMFRDKDNIFCLAISLLELIVFAVDDCMIRCASRENLKRLKGIHSLSLRKIDMARKTESGRRKSVGVNDRRKTAGVYDGRKSVGGHDKRTKIAPGNSAKKTRDEESEELFDTKNGLRSLENILRCTRDSKLK